MLSTKFQMKDLNDLHYFLDVDVDVNVDIFQTLDVVLLSRWHYMLNLLYKFRMNHLNTSRSKDEAKCKPRHVTWVHIISIDNRVLIYLMITWPGHVNPCKTHMDCAKCVLRFVCGTLDHNIFYKHGVLLQLIRFTDVDWVGINTSNKRSPSGFMSSLSKGEEFPRAIRNT